MEESHRQPRVISSDDTILETPNEDDVTEEAHEEKIDSSEENVTRDTDKSNVSETAVETEKDKTHNFYLEEET